MKDLNWSLVVISGIKYYLPLFFPTEEKDYTHQML